MNENVIVLHARDTGKAVKAAAGKGFAWLYLGQNIAQRQNIARRLGGERRYFTGPLLQETAHQQKEPFLDFLAGLGKKQKNRLYWWASDAAYRNPLTSDLFLLWCYTVMLEKVIDRREWDGKKRLVVIVRDRWLHQALRQRYGAGDKRLSFLSNSMVWPEALKLSLRRVAVRLLFVYRAFRYFLESRRMKPPTKTDNTGQVYLYSWIQDRFFNTEGQFNDAYFGRLPDILKADGKKVDYITPPFLAPPLKKKCLDCKDFEFTFLDSYLSTGGILRSALACPRTSYRGGEKWVGTLLRRQELHEFSFQNHLAYYHAFRKWLEESAPKKAVIIYPFENQPWEKMLCRAVDESDKQIKLVAYQHSTVPSLVLNYFPGEGEAEDMPLPHCIVAASDRALETLNNAGYGGKEIINGGALRFEHLQSQKNTKPKTRGSRPPSVLVALPYMLDLMQELLLSVFNAFADFKDSPRIIIKFHPAVSSKNLRISLPNWPAHFETTEKPVSEMLGETDLVICSSANIILEMAVAGIPAIRYRSEHTLCLDEMEGLEEGAVKGCYENDMRNVVLSVLNGEDAHPPQDVSKQIARFYAPVDEEVWKEVVKFD
jgi:hypothetical protein